MSDDYYENLKHRLTGQSQPGGRWRGGKKVWQTFNHLVSLETRQVLIAAAVAEFEGKLVSDRVEERDG